MLLVGATSAACGRPCNPRSWGGFGESAPWRTSTSIGLSVQPFRDNEPTCSLAVWACVVPPSVMLHAVLLGRDSWMRFNTGSYRALPPRPHDNRVFGELTLSRLPEPATEHDRSGSTSLNPVEDGGIYLTRACGLNAPSAPIPRVGLGGLVRTESAVLGRLPFTSANFYDFAHTGHV